MLVDCFGLLLLDFKIRQRGNIFEYQLYRRIKYDWIALETYRITQALPRRMFLDGNTYFDFTVRREKFYRLRAKRLHVPTAQQGHNNYNMLVHFILST
jgi:hypothetical protein